MKKSRRYQIREDETPRFANMYGFHDRRFIGHNPKLIQDEIIPREYWGYGRIRACLRRFRPR